MKKNLLVVGLAASFSLWLLAGGLELSDLRDVTGTITQVQIGKLKRMKTKRSFPVCESFALTEEEVRFFFDHATLIGGQELERAYEWFPCVVEGKVVTDIATFSWSISPAGSGALKSEGGEEFYAVCDEGCLEIFPHGGQIQHD